MTYTEAFFAGNAPIALRSAEVVLPPLLAELDAWTVIDVGCAQGAWLSVAKRKGRRVMGVDRFVPDEHLLIGADEFDRRDLTEGVDCTGYDLAMCLEVAEHLPAEAAQRLVAGLCQARWVLFSPAHPGQGGVHHVNEAWGSWWQALFAEHGYVGSSDLKWRHWADQRVEDYYRENMLLFSTTDRLAGARFREGVVDVIHPQRLATWPGP